MADTNPDEVTWHYTESVDHGSSVTITLGTTGKSFSETGFLAVRATSAEKINIASTGAGAGNDIEEYDVEQTAGWFNSFKDDAAKWANGTVVITATYEGSGSAGFEIRQIGRTPATT